MEGLSLPRPEVAATAPDATPNGEVASVPAGHDLLPQVLMEAAP